MAGKIEENSAQMAAYREVMERMPALVRLKAKLRSSAIEPNRVLLPVRLNVPYEGDDATDFEGSLMNLPITWSDKEMWGLIVTLPDN